MAASSPSANPSTRDTDVGGTSGTEFAALMRLVKSAGLLDRRPRYYLAKTAATGGLLGAGWAGFLLVGDSWWQLAIAAFLAAAFGQIAFIGHDAGHRQIAQSKRINDLIGFVHSDLAVGLSFGWWVDKHNRHHAHPNTEDQDPDLDIDALAFTTGQAQAKRNPLTRFIARHQRYLFFPLLLLEAVQLHVSSVRALVSGRLRNRTLEAVMLGLHTIGYLAVVLLVLSPVKAAVFIVAHQALFGLYLGCSFAPNHKGMPILAANDRSDFLRRQVLTSRNVRGGVLVDFALGGLNYQIEHHLFPSMPRPNLRRAQSLVKAFCIAHNVTYHETTLLGSYAQALRHLHQVGGPLRASAGVTGVR